MKEISSAIIVYCGTQILLKGAEEHYLFPAREVIFAVGAGLIGVGLYAWFQFIQSDDKSPPTQS